MALTHLLDSSVLTRLRHRAVREAIEGRAERGELGRAGISDLESRSLIVLHYDADFDRIAA